MVNFYSNYCKIYHINFEFSFKYVSIIIQNLNYAFVHLIFNISYFDINTIIYLFLKIFLKTLNIYVHTKNILFF